MDEATLNAFATKIALHCQKAARGMKARDMAQIKRWEKANVAAYRIQVWHMIVVNYNNGKSLDCL
jgi:hypothetical protein